MRITECGRILFAEDFWDCECVRDFVHRKSTLPRCAVCGFECDELPDSRISEILIYFPELLTQDERQEIVKKYIDMAGLLG